MSARVMSRGAELVLRAASDVDVPEEWSPSSSSACIHFADRVQVDDAIRHVVQSRRRTAAHDPHATLLVSDLRATHGDARMQRARMDAADDDPRFAVVQQEAVGSVVHGDSRVHAGSTWVMPCGTGKTLAACKLAAAAGVRTLVVAPNVETCAQWKAGFVRMGVADVFVYGVDAGVTRLALLTRPPCVCVVTYSTLSAVDRAGDDASDEARVVCRVLSYGLLVLDECHLVPAHTYEAAAANVAARARLAVTASLCRTDSREARVLDAVGPVRYALTRERAKHCGVVSSVSLRVVRVPTCSAVRRAYAEADTEEERRVLAACHPAKMRTLTRLLAGVHAKKALVYCDKVAALPVVVEAVTRVPGVVFAGVFSGHASKEERAAFLRRMRASPSAVGAGAAIVVGVLTRAGSASIDVQDVDAVVEVDVGDTSLQKLTQRVGRAQRVHESKTGAASAYALASLGTREEHFATQRTEAERERGEHVEWIDADADADGDADADADAAAILAWARALIHARVEQGCKRDMEREQRRAERDHAEARSKRLRAVA